VSVLKGTPIRFLGGETISETKVPIRKSQPQGESPAQDKGGRAQANESTSA
jgi:hypothetical protein